MRRRCVVLCLALCGAFSLPASSAAEPIVIAAFDTPPFETAVCCSGGAYQQQFSQSFIATAGGTITRVDVLLWASAPRNGDITLSLYKAAAGIPVGPVLTTSRLGADAVPASCCSADPPFVSFELPGTSVTQGDALAFVLDGTSQAQWSFPSGVDLDGFLSRRAYGSLEWNRPFDGSGSFRVFGEVDGPSPVPEPGTLLLFSTGLLVLVGRRVAA